MDNKVKDIYTNLGLPDDLDWKVVVGYLTSSTIDILVFSKKAFEETGCEYESEVFRVTVFNKTGSTGIITQEGNTESVHNMEKL
jgi:hypothetical protein